ncbi:MAG TPA: DUF4153 domain-containing protein [Rhizomicrobium sp.]|jgi:hypothetical protein
MSSEETHEVPSGAIGLARLAVGLAQGIALYLLYISIDDKTWPSTDPYVFAPLGVALLYVPLLALQGLGNIRLRTLIPWLLIAAGVMAGLAWYDIWTRVPIFDAYNSDYALRANITPSFAVFFFGAVWLFIAHALVAGGDADRRIVARYTTHFDVAWKLAVQLALTFVFTVVFWSFLWLGAALFRLIDLNFFETLLEDRWFSIPATTLAIAVAFHVTDMRAGLVRGTRTLVLVLLSWLLPMLALIVGAFLLALPFTGLAPLWKFGHASALLLTTAAGLIILINAAHQDGQQLPPRVMRIAGSIASVMLAVLVGIAGYALWLRVAQYGWTADRVATAACVLVAAFYAVGYMLAALPGGVWLARIESWNFYAALLVLGVLLALFTPLANPDRIAVADQVARLHAGKVSVAQFDFYYLGRAGRYGHDALVALESDKSPAIADAAKLMLTSPTPLLATTIQPDIRSRISVYPASAVLPPNFLAQLEKTDFNHAGGLPVCFYSSKGRCDAILIDVDGDGQDEILLTNSDGPEYNPSVYRQINGRWDLYGHFAVGTSCGAFYNALRGGKATLVPPPATGRDVIVGIFRFPFVPADRENQNCQ